MAAAIATRFLDGESVKIIQIQKDRNGRIVAIVIMPDGLPLQEILLLHGMAWVDNRYCKSQKCEAWRALEAAARISGRGIWKSPKPTAPWDWRRQRRRGTLKGYE